jgi:type IV secretion system pilin
MRLISHRPGYHTPALRPPNRRDHRPFAPTPTRAVGCRRTDLVPEAPTSPRRSRRPVLLLGCTSAVAALLLSGSAAHADTVQYVALAQSVDQVLSNIRTWIMGILAGVALVFLTIGGLRYLMASNDPGEIEKAKGAFKAAGIGFGLAALAPLVVEILKTIVGGV